jgi:hypothetical protein
MSWAGGPSCESPDGCMQHYQLDLVDLFHSRCPSTQPNTMTAARRSQRKRSSRTLVLMATMRSSANDSQDQTISRAHLRQEHSTSASDRPRFSRIHGVPTGAPQLFRDKVGGYPVRIKITNPDHSALVGIGSNSGGLESA